jgi:hypothetical protein
MIRASGFAILKGMRLAAFAVLPLALGTVAASAQQTSVERTAKGPAAKDIRVGVYLNVQPDCTSGMLPAIRLISPPTNGTLTVKRGSISATNYKKCMALEVPGFIAFYRSNADFSGTDVMTIEVKFPQGRTEIQRITVQIGDSTTQPGGRAI